MGIYDGLEDGEGVDGKLDENYGSSKTRRVKCVCCWLYSTLPALSTKFMFCNILGLEKMERREQRYSNKIIKIFLRVQEKKVGSRAP